LNDPESREVYWIDHPDLAASAQEIQVQRGVGASTYGTTAIGGSVNVETVPYSQNRYLTLEAGAGSFGTQRYVAQGSSGLLDSKYALSARLSRILTDGYREASWSDLWSYFVGIARVDPKLVTRLNLYGGPEETHLAYLGVPKSYLDGEVTGDQDQDRRFNPITYRNERDHFFEPHYELLSDWKASEKVTASSALFYFPGKGYYEEFREDSDLRDYNYPDDPSTPAATDIVRQRWVKNVHLGWVPRARYVNGRYEGEAGLDLRFHEGRHWGELVWSDQQPASPEPNHVYYDYKGQVINTSAFLRQSYAIAERLRGTLDLALHHQGYELKDDAINGQFFDEDYTFFSPRVGLIWTVNEAPEKHLEAYGSWSRAEAEPIFRELYDPGERGLAARVRHDPAHGRAAGPARAPREGRRLRARPARARDVGRGVARRLLDGFQGRDRLQRHARRQRQPDHRQRGAIAPPRDRSVPDRARDQRARFPGLVPVVERPFVDYAEYVDSATTIDYSGNRIAGFPDVQRPARGLVPLRPRAHRARRRARRAPVPGQQRGRGRFDRTVDGGARGVRARAAGAVRQQADRGHRARDEPVRCALRDRGLRRLSGAVVCPDAGVDPGGDTRVLRGSEGESLGSVGGLGQHLAARVVEAVGRGGERGARGLRGEAELDARALHLRRILRRPEAHVVDRVAQGSRPAERLLQGTSPGFPVREVETSRCRCACDGRRRSPRPATGRADPAARSPAA
jgi:hypothetical protein